MRYLPITLKRCSGSDRRACESFRASGLASRLDDVLYALDQRGALNSDITRGRAAQSVRSHLVKPLTRTLSVRVSNDQPSAL
jgi:hypothetical protein